ncbi:hypothetical protein MNBD_ALPHA09-1935 [hydrothermal vent metagenome]|uniref:Uncharacterized protein n=1 Tax=hydrothermal vent metagenome TaxID=652676 RepID=A0A3B0TBA1_9ZZZZ
MPETLTTKSMSPQPPPAVELPVRVVKSYPLITVSKTYRARPFGVAPLLAAHVPGRKSLNLVQLCWTYETAEKVSELVADLEHAKSIAPDSEFVILANTEFESYLLSDRGVPNTMASETMFMDEQVFRPQPRIEKTFEAVYNGRIAPMKRHELAEGINRRLLIYCPDWEDDREYAEMYRRKPTPAVFLNHQLGGGKYCFLPKDEVNRHMNQARVGLCLSATEGIMRASIEYLYCGLPVVSTPCYGGRERYYHPDYCRIVEPDRNAVTKAVRDLARADIDPFFVRRRTLSIINRERTNFIRFVNSLARYHFGIRHLFPDFEPFRGNVDYVDIQSIIERLKGRPGA